MSQRSGARGVKLFARRPSTEVIVLIATAALIAFVSLSGVVARYLATYPPAQCEQCTQEGPSGSSQHGQLSELPAEVSPNDFKILGDTIAQWLLVLISIAGAGISVAAVLLVRDTLGVNRDALKLAGDANKNAREVGFAQIRAYVSLVSLIGKTDPTDHSFSISVSIQNSGQTPAHDITVRVWLVRTDEDGRDVLTHGSRSFEDHSDLMPSERRAIYSERVAFYQATNDPKQVNSLEAYLEKRTGYFLRGFIRYKAVGIDWQRETAFNYRVSGWHTLQPADLVFTRETEGNRRT